MFFYKFNDLWLFSQKDEYSFDKISKEQALAEAKELFYLFPGRAGEDKASFLLNSYAMIHENKESINWLNDYYWQKQLGAQNSLIDDKLAEFINNGRVMAVNTGYPNYLKLLRPKAPKGKKRVNILALGDVGGTLLMGLKLLGGEIIESIGIYDINPKVAQRWEMEMNQISPPWDYQSFPHVEIINKDQLFNGDMLVFCPSVGVPPLGKEAGDVRMIQLEGNKKIVAQYAKAGGEEGFKGIFAVVSDPVDPLCKAAFLASNTDDKGNFHWQGLRPEQIKGYGLGVMNARGAYYALKEEAFNSFLTQGRAYGPHGGDLVLANSINNYDDEASQALTELAVKANLRTRETGFKPYIAPALSSGAISIIRTLMGEWHYSSNFLAGVYMGAKNRNTDLGLELEALPLPEKLFKRIEHAYQNLAEIDCSI